MKSNTKTRRPAPRKKEPLRLLSPLPTPTKPRIYILEVFLLGGNYTAKFAKQNPVVARTIQIRGDQTLEDLHEAIFDAYGRWEQHFYEFQFGKGPMDPEGPRYVLPAAFDTQKDEDNAPTGMVDQTTLDSLQLTEESQFGYWFDYGDDWWHQINVVAIEEKPPRGTYPKVIKRVGKSPPQYPPEEDEEE